MFEWDNEVDLKLWSNCVQDFWSHSVEVQSSLQREYEREPFVRIYTGSTTY